jgi:hypothetical protein
MRHPIRRYRAWTARRRYAALCRDLYFHADHEAGELRDQLARTTDHGRRHQLLVDLSDVEMEMSHRGFDGWGAQPNADEGGRLVSESMRLASVLLLAVAYAEEELGREQRRGRRVTHETLELEFQVGPVLDAAIAAGRIDRAVLDDLHAAVYPVVGRQAAKVIACLPLPGGRSDYKVAG